MTVDEPDYAEELATNQARLTPAMAAAIAAGIALSETNPEFPDLPVPEATVMLLGALGGYNVLAAAPTEILRAVALSATARRTPPGVRPDPGAARVGLEAGLSQVTRVAQSAAARAIANPPASMREFGAPGNPPAERLRPYARADLAARGVANTVTNAAASAAATAAGHTHKTWESMNDAKVRPTHNVLDSHAWPEHTVPVGQPFVSPSGALLMFPGDPTAPLDETMNCRCHLRFTTPKRGESYGETADLPTNPPQMQGNPGVLNPVTASAHDLIFYENRRTPEVVAKGAKGKKGGAGTKAGKVVKRRAATAEEEKQIRNGGWVRVNQSGDKPGDSGYKRKKSGVRPQKELN